MEFGDEISPLSSTKQAHLGVKENKALDDWDTVLDLASKFMKGNEGPELIDSFGLLEDVGVVLDVLGLEGVDGFDNMAELDRCSGLPKVVDHDLDGINKSYLGKLLVGGDSLVVELRGKEALAGSKSNR